ncbi:MAG: TonB-dependent receptor [Leptospiraceae bacterium]|nr:TonB-dependent receptor [Leptospiraceae bacterium]
MFDLNAQEVKKANTLEVIGTSKENEVGKTKSVKSDPTGFTEVIDAEKFRGKYTSLTDVLEREAGVRVRRFGGLGSYSTLSIRGSNANQVRIYVDGVPLNNAQGGEINLSDLSFDNLEKIEIYKSGSSPGFSGSAIGGTVNLVTSKSSRKPSTRFLVSGGSLNTYKISASHNGSVNNVRYSLFTQNEKSDQNFIFRSNNGTFFNSFDNFDDRRRNAQFNRYNFTGNLSFDVGQTVITFLNDFNYRQNGIPGPGNNQTKKVEREYIRNTSSLGTNTKSFLFTNLNFDTRVFYTGVRDHLFDPLSEFSSGTPNSKADIQNYGLHLLPSLYLLNSNQILRFFVAFERETFKRDRRNRFDEIVDRSTRKFRYHTTWQIQDEIRLLDKRLILTPTIQQELYIDRFNSKDEFFRNTQNEPNKKTTQYTNYRMGLLGILYKNTENTFSFKANIARERRIPDFLELFGERGSVIGNLSLKPERSVNMDAGFIYDTAKKNIKFTTSIAYFQKNITDMILFVPNSQFSLRPENIDSASIKGVELAQNLTLFGNWKLESNYTYQKAINTSDVSYLKGKYLPLRPLHEWHGSISRRFDAFELGLENIFIGAVFKDRANEYQNYQEARWLHNLFFTYYFKRSTEEDNRELLVSFEVKNITDKRAEDIIGYPLPGRIWYGTLSGKF